MTKEESNFTKEIGLDLVGYIDEQYIVKLKVEDRHLNMAGTLHGGALCTLLDTAMGRAFHEGSGKKLGGATLELKINFLKPSKAETLTAYGKLINTTRRTAYVEGYVENEQGELVGKASSTIMIKDPSTRSG